MTRGDDITALAAAVEARSAACVGVDGVDGAGKTVFANTTVVERSVVVGS